MLLPPLYTLTASFTLAADSHFSVVPEAPLRRQGHHSTPHVPSQNVTVHPYASRKANTYRRHTVSFQAAICKVD